jgi:hypothetical protein
MRPIFSHRSLDHAGANHLDDLIDRLDSGAGERTSREI